MKVSIFIVTFKRDFPYLHWCLRSIEKFARGFHEVVILVPNQDMEDLRKMVAELPGESGIPFRCVSGEEWSEAGMMWHEAMIVSADLWLPDADVICHGDADTILIRPTTPEDFLVNGKPLLRYEHFDSIGRRHNGVLEWQRVTELCLPFPVRYETMRGHYESFARAVYPETRKQMEIKTGMKWDAYIRSCKNSFPNGYCEFVTLGNVAMEKFQSLHSVFDCGRQENPDYCGLPVGQFWSHSPPDLPQDIWWQGKQVRMVPIEKIMELGIA